MNMSMNTKVQQYVSFISGSAVKAENHIIENYSLIFKFAWSFYVYRLL